MMGKLLGIIGDQRVGKSLSPRMHRAALQSCGLKGDYVPVVVGEHSIAQAMAELWSSGYDGVNVTVPYKQLVMPYLQDIAGQAREIGAVNTLVRGELGFIGHNTDIIGCVESIKMIDRQHSVALVGTGGAARAMLAALRGLGHEKIHLLGRNREKTEVLAGQFAAAPISPLPEGFAANWFINATSASTRTEATDLDAWRQTVFPMNGVIDLNYGRDNNFWRAMAEHHNVFFMDGLTMLAWQAKYSFQLWTGKEVAIDIFQEAL